ncbi:hypothetical protein QAD02_017390 [Eretmocerus hayati]|uniref:Uncharacterized protein n=1 Tax=Eretmocerus hayati TaxID=131215 RepID=A0ACC2PEV4_9HYME|nr:hypothetical protein QAD02_017390 [Eretmocerus hayati]
MSQSSQKRRSSGSQSPSEGPSQPKRARASRSQELSQDSYQPPVYDDDQELVSGKILRVSVKNFMCHDHLEVVFNEQVNFIIGKNGSGKSAILTALTVGLGARASATDRGASAKEFIKTGKTSGSVEIDLTNRGPLAYKYETYGDKITVIRTIGNTSSYRIKNYRGETISTKKEELNKIVSCMNIQVDNPVSVLSQDAARSFLNGKGPKEKFKFFMKATRLEDIHKNYTTAREFSELAKTNLEEAKQFMSKNEKEVRDLNKKLQRLASLDESRALYEELGKEMKWAMVHREEKKLLQIETRINDQSRKVEDMEGKEREKALKEQEIDSQISNLKKEIEEIESRAADGNAKLDELKRICAAAKRRLDDKKGETKTFHENLKKNQANISMLQDAIKKMNSENSETDEKKRRAESETQDNLQKLDDIEATLRTKQTDLMHWEETKRRLEQEVNAVKIDVEQKRRELRKFEQSLEAMKRQPDEAYSVYGPNMSRLVKRIDEEHKRNRFIRKPVGPIGSYIKVNDPKWIPAVEGHLGYWTLSQFCVDNCQDRTVLDKIMKEIYGREKHPQITISKFLDRVHDVRSQRTGSNRHSNLLDMMEISNPIAANCLIDGRQIEATLLIPTSDEACDIMSNSQKVPPHCRQAITQQADIFHPEPNYRSYHGTVSRKYLQVSTQQAIQLLEEDIRKSQLELKSLEMRQHEVNDRMKKNHSEYDEAQRCVRSLQRQQMQVKGKLDELKETIESCNNDAINTFSTELEELQKLVVEERERLNHLMEEFRQANKEYESSSGELKSHRKLVENVDSTLNPIRENIRELSEEKKRLQKSNQGADRRIREGQLALQQLNSDRDRQQRVVTSAIESAETLCPRIATQKSPSEIENKMKDLKTDIDSVEKQIGTKAAIEAALEEKKNKFGDVLERAKKLEEANERQLVRLAERRRLYKEMKKTITENVQMAFSNILKLRNYKGSITIDHTREEIYLAVSPKNDAKRTTNDPSALSGGERSYSTVALILALWNCIGVPFYFMDEFDVFMDKVNRYTIIDILIAHAKENPQSQFTFLTPLPTNIIRENAVSIHKLADPERA